MLVKPSLLYLRILINGFATIKNKKYLVAEVLYIY